MILARQLWRASIVFGFLFYIEIGSNDLPLLLFDVD